MAPANLSLAVYSLFLSLGLRSTRTCRNFSRVLILSRLESLVLMKDVVVEGLGEDTIDLLSQVDLGQLQLGQVVGHHCVLEVGLNHLLEQDHVTVAELSQTLVEKNTNIRIPSLLIVNNRLNVIFALPKTLNEFLQILEHKLSV